MFSWEDDADPLTEPLNAQKPPAGSPGLPAMPGYDQVFGADPSTPAASPGRLPSGPDKNLASSLTSAPANPAASQDWDATPSWQTGGGDDFASASRNAAARPGAAAPGASAADAMASQKQTPYADALTKLKQTADPAQKAVLQDQLARTLFSTLKTSGHDVKWQGDQLIVDGRPYVVGGGDSFDPAQRSDNTGVNPGGAVDGTVNANAGAWDTDGYAKPGFTATASGGPPPGWDGAKWNDPNHQTPKYVVGRIMASHPNTPDGRAAMIADIQKAYPGTTFNGKDRIEVPGIGPVDIFGAAGAGEFRPQWLDLTAEAQQRQQQGPAMASQNLAGPLSGGAASVNVGGVPQPGGLAAAGFATSAPGYTPGEIGTADIPDFSFEQLMAQMSGQAPAALETDYEAGTISNAPLDAYEFDGLGDLGELGAGDTEPLTEDLIKRILENPESLDDRTIESLKARHKDELGEMQLTEDDDLRAVGAQMGIGDSPWLASERLQGKRDRDRALTDKNRDIDIEAAATRMGDRRAAAALGQSFGDSVSGRNRADRSQRLTEATTAEGLKQSSVDSTNKASAFKREGELANEQLRGQAFERRNAASQQNIDNAFRSTAEKQAAVKLASDTVLQAASARQDRMVLREAINQKATELGQNGDEIQLQYTLGLMDDITRRYGIDVGASIDRAKLAQAGREFQEDLAFRLQALAQANDQFGATYGLQHAQTQHAIDQDHYQRWRDSQSLDE